MPLFRRVYFIQKDFQSRFILRFVLTITIWAVAAISLFLLMAERKMEELLYSPHITVKTTAELLMPSIFQAHALALVLFTGILLYALHSLWKRLSVPLYSLKKDITRIAMGDLVSGVVLRDDEEFQGLAKDVDNMRSSLRRSFVRLKERHLELSGAARELEKALLKGKLSAGEVAALQKKVSQMQEELRAFSY